MKELNQTLVNKINILEEENLKMKKKMMKKNDAQQI